MSRVLAEDVTLKCAAPTPTPGVPHGGALSVRGVSRLRVDGNSVLTKSSITAGAIAACADTNANASQVPCKKAQSPSGASKLKVDGDPVVLDNVSATTDGTPPGVLAVSGTVHDRLKAV